MKTSRTRAGVPMTSPFPRALLLGAVAGMRSQLPIALLGLESARVASILAATGWHAGSPHPAAWPQRSWRRSVNWSATSYRHPGPGPAGPVYRAGCGRDLVGAAVYRDADQPVAYGAVVGAVAAAASTLALIRARTALGRRTALPDRVWGVEDVLAFTLGLLAIRSRPGSST